MKNLRKWILSAASLLLLTALAVPGKAAPWQAQPSFENTDGMTVDLVYFCTAEDGTEQIVGKAERTIIPAGTSSVTLEIQQHHLPQGYSLKDPQELPLAEDTLEVKIPVQEAQTNDPTEAPDGPAGTPEDKPQGQQPEDKPEGKPDGKPEEKPDSSKPEGTPDPKPQEKPQEKPEVKPDGKPNGKPQKPKPDSTNPQTGDPFAPGLWLAAGLLSASALLLIRKKCF